MLAESVLLGNQVGQGFSNDGLSEVLLTLSQLNRGELCPRSAGYVYEKPHVHDGIDKLTYVQPRVASWNGRGYLEQDIVKLKTMYDLTETGSQLEAELVKLIESGNTAISTKDIAKWRVCRPLMRKLSVDELPQLIFNVIGLGQGHFPNLMHMQLVGAARPPLAREIQVHGDDSHDFYNRALEKVANNNKCSRMAVHLALGEYYVPGLVTPATARGRRQLNSQDGFDAWVSGIIEFERLNNLSKTRKTYELGRLITQTAINVTTCIDAV